MTSTDTLLPCPVPWCVSDVLEVVRSPWSRGYGVSCQNCRAQGPDCATETEAIAAWNHRTPPTPATDARDLIERVGRAIEASGNDRDAMARAALTALTPHIAAIEAAAEANERARIFEDDLPTLYQARQIITDTGILVGDNGEVFTKLGVLAMKIHHAIERNEHGAVK